MSTSWMIHTQNDPLGAVRAVLLSVWDATNLERILLPLNGNSIVSGPNVITSVEQIQMFNPFTPLMPINAARLIPKLVSSGEKVAAVLRPCEIRTLEGMIKLNQININNLMTVSVDCLGTLPADEFEWRARRKGSPKGLAQEALQFARQGGIVPYRYRAACQICESPEARKADINIGVLGLPVRQYLIVNIQDDELAKSLQSEYMIPVKNELVSNHRNTVDRLAERGNASRERIFAGLVGMLPSTIDSIVEPLQECDDCRACLDACPICIDDFPRQDTDGVYNRDDVMEWLVSCSECGVCEQTCPKHLPLTIIFSYIRNQFAELRE